MELIALNMTKNEPDSNNFASVCGKIFVLWLCDAIWPVKIFKPSEIGLEIATKRVLRVALAGLGRL